MLVFLTSDTPKQGLEKLSLPHTTCSMNCCTALTTYQASHAMALLHAALCQALAPCGASLLLHPGHCSTFPHPPGLGGRRRPYPRIEARHNARRENAKVRSRRLSRKFNGTPTKPRLSVFCSNKQLYAMLVDDQSKKILFYGSTLQKSMHDNPSCSTVGAAQRVGEELIKVCKELDITEISSYDRNGFARGEKMMAFEIPVAQHGFLPR